MDLYVITYICLMMNQARVIAHFILLELSFRAKIMYQGYTIIYLLCGELDRVISSYHPLSLSLSLSPFLFYQMFPNGQPSFFHKSLSYLSYDDWINTHFVVNQLSHGPILALEDVNISFFLSFSLSP